MSGIERRALIVGVVGAGAALLLQSEDALAADPKLDLADAAVEKAIALLRAAQGPENRAFGGHRNNALVHLQHARDEIKKAKDWANSPPNRRPGPSDRGR